MKNKTPSAFVQSALALDDAFQELEDLAGSISRLELNSETALEKARALLLRFGERSSTLGAALQELGQKLDERRVSVEQAAVGVSERMPLIQDRFLEAEEKLQRFQALGARVREVTDAARSLGPSEVVLRLRALMDEAAALQEDARASQLRGLEKNIQTLRHNLRGILHKLDNATGGAR